MDSIQIISFLTKMQETLWDLREEVLSSVGEVNNALTVVSLEQDQHALVRVRADVLQNLGRIDAALAHLCEQIEKVRSDLEQRPPTSAQ